MNSASANFDLHLGILRERLLHPTDYELGFHYFLQEFAGDPAFMKQSQIQDMPVLVEAVRQMAVQALGREVEITQPRLYSLPDRQFFHGRAGVDGRAVILFYFAAENTGLMAMIPGVQGNAQLARFSIPDSLPVDLSEN